MLKFEVSGLVGNINIYSKYISMYSEEHYKLWLEEFPTNPEKFPTSMEWLEFLLMMTKKHKKPSVSEQGYEYWITFTLKKGADPREAEKRIIGFSSMKQIQATEWWVTLEYTLNGVEHWHCLVRCKNSVKTDFFRTYLKNFGTIKLQKITKGSSERVLKYMSEDEKPINIMVEDYDFQAMKEDRKSTRKIKPALP